MVIHSIYILKPGVVKGGIFLLEELATILGISLGFFRGFWVDWLFFCFLSSFGQVYWVCQGFLVTCKVHTIFPCLVSLPCLFIFEKTQRCMHLVKGHPVYIHALHNRQPTYIRNLLMQQPASLFHESILKKREFSSFMIEVQTSQGFLESTRVFICGHSFGVSSSLLVSLVFLCFP